MNRMVGLVAVVVLLQGSVVRGGDTALLDTGTPDHSSGPVTLRSQASGYQSFAGAFSTSQPQVIQHVAAYFEEPSWGAGMTYRITGVRPDGYPDLNDELFSVTISNVDTDGDPDGAWYGADDLSWALPAGDYFLVLDPQLGFTSGMPRDVPHPTVAPFTNNADLSVVAGDGWRGLRTRGVGMRVMAAGGCPGDADGDGDVDLSDLSLVLANFGASGAGSAGDVDQDQDVDLTDLSLVLANFGATCA